MKITVKSKDGQKIIYSDPSVDNPNSEYVVKILKEMQNVIQFSHLPTSNYTGLGGMTSQNPQKQEDHAQGT